MEVVTNSVGEQATYSRRISVTEKFIGKDQSIRILRVTVEWSRRQQQEKVLSLLLSDDDNPCILFNVVVSSEDFANLKRQQELLISYDSFMEHLVMLLDQCEDPENSKFKLIMSDNSSLTESHGQNLFLLIEETTNFKTLTHLCLTVVESSDGEIKRQMSIKINLLKEKVDSLEAQLVTTKQDLVEVLDKLDVISKESDNLSTEYKQKKDEMHIHMANEIARLKDLHSRAQTEWQKSSELEKKCIEDKYEDMINDLEAQVSTLKIQVKGSNERYSALDTSHRDLKKQYESLEKELNFAQKESALVRNQNLKLDADYHEKARSFQSLRTRYAVLDQENKTKSELLIKQKEEIEQLQDQKDKLESTLVEKEVKFEREQMSLQSSLQTLSQDLIKANELLSLHQTELVAVKSKLELSSKVAFEQERILDTKTRLLTESDKKLEKNTEKMTALEEETKKLRETLRKVENLLDEKEKRIRINEDVIGRLNRRLRESYTQGAGSSQWPQKGRGPVHFMGPKTTSTPLTTLNVRPPYVHSGLVPRVVPGNRALMQAYMPIRTSGPPQHGFGRSQTTTIASSGASGPASHGDVTDEPSETPSDKSTARSSGREVKTDEASSRDVRSSTMRRHPSAPGGIQRGDPAVISAYFNITDGDEDDE